MGVTGLWDASNTILRPSGKLRSLTHLAVVDGFEANPANLRGLRIGIDASIWFFHAAYGREGENPELRTLFFRCARLTSAPFLPVFIFDGPKRPKVKRGKKISGEKHWLVDSMKGMIEAFGFEWRMAPGEAEAELAYLNNIGVIDAILSDDVDNFLFGAKMVIRNPSANLTGNSKHTTKNADGRVDGNHSTVYTSTDILAHPSVQLTRGGLILIGLLSGGDYHPAGLSRCGSGIAHGLAKCGLGDELLEAAQTLTRDELPEFLTTWREALRNELRTNSRGHLGSKKRSLANAVPDSFPDLDVLRSYTNPITSKTDAGARRTHTPPKWEREPDLAKIAHLCELHFEWGLKDVIIKRFRNVLWPSIVLRALRRSALEDTTHRMHYIKASWGHHQTACATFFVYGSRTARPDDEKNGLGELIVKIHGTRMHAYTDGILEYRLEIAPAQLVCLASAGIQGLRKPADTTYDVLPSESDESDDPDGDAGTCAKKKRRGGPAPEPDSHLRVWMPACMVRFACPDLVNQYEVALEAKRAKKSSKRTRALAKGKGMSVKKTAAAPVPPIGFGRTSTRPSFGYSLAALPTTPSQGTLTRARPGKPKAAARGRDVSANRRILPTGAIHEDTVQPQENPQHILDVTSDDDEPGPSRRPPLSSPSKVLQRLDLNLNCATAFPFALEEEESTDDDLNRENKPAKPNPPTTPPPRPPRPLPIAHEEEESSDDPDTSPRHDGTSPRVVSNETRIQLRQQIAGTPTPFSRDHHGVRNNTFRLRSSAEAREAPDSGDSDGGDLALAPLLIARSRTAMSQRLAATHEIIDLT
ncbi:hypothetical protein B0F90DRAFT_1912851 [Multifurca ochricompacta]|uniref:XPG-I domain-containing protein n=1 Tax=Multifurca ochricompacta TaxID=376703 RepID=A0AAD4LZS2_9AGAM|nr:hypothetical protein B0F90DRAFT_1912851 [Multifurca ochricompacta]